MPGIIIGWCEGVRGAWNGSDASRRRCLHNNDIPNILGLQIGDVMLLLVSFFSEMHLLTF